MASSIINSDDGVISGTSGLKSSGGDDGVLVFQSKGTETARINTDKQIVAAAGTASLPIYSTTGDLNTGIYFPAADNIGFATGGTIRGRWTTDGLCFGTDTSSANALDDYEEGTWTPVLEGSTSNPSGTYSNQTGGYTKIGRIVYVYWQVAFNSGYSVGGGDFRLSGLPFTATAEQMSGNFALEVYNADDTQNSAVAKTNNGATYIMVIGNRDNNGWQNFVWSNFNTGQILYFYGGMTYQAA